MRFYFGETRSWGKIPTEVLSIFILILIVIPLQALVTATGGTDTFVEDASRTSTESRGAEEDNDALSVLDNDVLDASIVSDDEEFAEGYVFIAYFIRILFQRGLLNCDCYVFTIAVR